MEMNKIYSIEIENIKYKFELNGETLFYLPEQGRNISVYQFNNNKILIPKVIIITRDNGIPLFALEPKKEDRDQFKIVTARKLYNDESMAFQWFEPLADNYRKLIWVNEDSYKEGTDAYLAYKHFKWQDIIDFSLIDRFMIAYMRGGKGDCKQKEAEGYLLVIIDNNIYWGDAIGQIPFTVNCMKNYIIKYEGNYDKAIKETIITGMEFGAGIPFTTDDSNSYDNYMILRGCLWSKKKFVWTKIIPAKGKISYIITPRKENFEDILNSAILKDQRDKYAQWNFEK